LRPLFEYQDICRFYFTLSIKGVILLIVGYQPYNTVFNKLVA